MAEKKTKTIEENMMNDTSIKLEESFKLYKEGLELVETCKKQLTDVEKEIEILEEQGK